MSSDPLRSRRAWRQANAQWRTSASPSPSKSNGSLTVRDKRTGAVYERQLTFEDIADIGDGWYHGMAVNDQAFTSTASTAAVSLVHDGPQLTTFYIRMVMQMPHRFEFGDEMRRSSELVDLVIENWISLRPGAAHLEVETAVHKRCRGSQAASPFPSGAKTDTYLADSPFDVVERPISSEQRQPSLP